MIEASASAEFPMAVAFCHYFSFNDLEFDEWILLGTVQIGQCYGNGYGTRTAKDILPKHKSIKAIILKPTLIGYPARFNMLMTHAQSENLQVSISSSFESPIAINQLHHLAQQWKKMYQVEVSLGLDTLHVYADAVLNKSEQLNGQVNPFLAEAECLWHR